MLFFRLAVVGRLMILPFLTPDWVTVTGSWGGSGGGGRGGGGAEIEPTVPGVRHEQLFTVNIDQRHARNQRTTGGAEGRPQLLHTLRNGNLHQIVPAITRLLGRLSIGHRLGRGVDKCSRRNRIRQDMRAIIERPAGLPHLVQDPVVMSAFGAPMAFCARVAVFTSRSFRRFQQMAQYMYV